MQDVQFTDNGVTALGCEFLGRTLGPGSQKTDENLGPMILSRLSKDLKRSRISFLKKGGKKGKKH